MCYRVGKANGAEIMEEDTKQLSRAGAEYGVKPDSYSFKGQTSFGTEGFDSASLILAF